MHVNALPRLTGGGGGDVREPAGEVWTGSTAGTEGRAQAPWHGDRIACQQGTRGGRPRKGGCHGRG